MSLPPSLPFPGRRSEVGGRELAHNSSWQVSGSSLHTYMYLSLSLRSCLPSPSLPVPPLLPSLSSPLPSLLPICLPPLDLTELMKGIEPDWATDIVSTTRKSSSLPPPSPPSPRALPFVLDSDEEVMTTRFEMSKMNWQKGHSTTHNYTPLLQLLALIHNRFPTLTALRIVRQSRIPFDVCGFFHYCKTNFMTIFHPLWQPVTLQILSSDQQVLM